MTPILAGSAVEGYYRSIDAVDIEGALSLFAEDAIYERADAVYSGRPRILEFFSHERRIRGKHLIEAILSLGERVIVLGRFEGVGASGDPRSVGFVDVWDFGQSGLVRKRRPEWWRGV